MNTHREIPSDAHICDYIAEVSRQARIAKFKAAVSSPDYAYSRARPICGEYVVTAYLRDTKSPTGVLGMASCDMEDAVAIMDAAGRPFPLSPTEGLNKSGATAH